VVSEVSGPTEPFEGVIPGLAAERTDLAWSRSGLSLMACGLAVAKALPVLRGEPARPGVATALLFLGAAVWLLGWDTERRRRSTSGRPRPPARYRDVAPVAYGTTAVGIAAVAVVLTSPA
jgi:uncharacterized membrane protein YidH (DUF202 family)